MTTTPIDEPHNAQTQGETPQARFGAELRRLREHAGLTVRRLGEELHRAHSGIVEYEGSRAPSLPRPAATPALSPTTCSPIAPRSQRRATPS
ncbi:MAG: hypothetical protein QOG94_354 [Solirubrobacteraceae bacterium]|jgi:hypothetical protein|nr:hypothetical protein [Solirubrobacteraceae bacterium]